MKFFDDPMIFKFQQRAIFLRKMFHSCRVHYIFCRHCLNFLRVRVVQATLVPGLCLQNIDQTKTQKAEKIPNIFYFNE